jgi:hypothetical protein
VVATRRLAVLANSRRPGGTCIAGWDLSPDGGWVRPIGRHTNEAVSHAESLCADGNPVQVLDVAEVTLLEARPNAVQPENWVIDASSPPWTRLGTASRADLERAIATKTTLWLNGWSSSNGINNRIPADHAVGLGSSLALIDVSSVTIDVSTQFGRKRAFARFEWAGEEYAMHLTDPALERRYKAMRDGLYASAGAYLTISLANPYKDQYCYKLVAAVIAKDSLA